MVFHLLETRELRVGKAELLANGAGVKGNCLFYTKIDLSK
jgi:hypothetical protein